MRFDATDHIELINQPLLMIAGSKAVSLYMTQDAFPQATGTTDKDEAATVRTVKARVLTDCVFGKANDVVTLPEDVANGAGGDLDTHPDAVAYAESLQAGAKG